MPCRAYLLIGVSTSGIIRRALLSGGGCLGLLRYWPKQATRVQRLPDLGNNAKYQSTEVSTHWGGENMGFSTLPSWHERILLAAQLLVQRPANHDRA